MSRVTRGADLLRPGLLTCQLLKSNVISIIKRKRDFA